MWMNLLERCKVMSLIQVVETCDHDWFTFVVYVNV
jgi:hypothetical protein